MKEFRGLALYILNCGRRDKTANRHQIKQFGSTNIDSHISKQNTAA